MKIFKKIYSIIFLSIIFSISHSDVSSASDNSLSSLIGKWERPPKIILCNSLNIKRGRIEKALYYWEKLGYSFGTVTYAGVENKSCIFGPSVGEITIDIPGQSFDFEKIAISTTSRIKGSSEIVFAHIQIQQNSVSKERVLEHEIGHALGWSHSKRKYHIMNESWSDGGHNSYGLNYRNYKI